MKPRLKNVLKNLALSLATFLICVALLELVLRCLGYGNLEIYEPDSKLYWKLKPNQNCFTKIDHKPVHITSHGTRGAEFNLQKPANTIRILSLGDSKTFGWGLTEAESYSGLLQTLLEERIGKSKNIEVINAGVNAWSYPQMTIYFHEIGISFDPDFVVLADANLWTQFSEKSDPAFVKKFMSRVRLKNFLRRFATYHYIVEVQLQDFYQRHRTKFIPVDPKQDALFKEQQQKDPDAFFKNAIEELCQTAMQHNVRPVVIHIPFLYDLEAGYESNVLKAKRDICKKLNIPFIDFTADLKPRGKALYLDADPVHLNADGNEIVARRLFETMSQLVTHE